MDNYTATITIRQVGKGVPRELQVQHEALRHIARMIEQGYSEGDVFLDDSDDDDAFVGAWWKVEEKGNCDI